MHNRHGKLVHGGERPLVQERSGAVVTVPRHDQMARRLHGIKSGGVLPTIKPELVHSVIQENDRAEFKYIAGEKLCAAGGAIGAGGAGTFTTFQLQNPAGSGILCVVTGIIASSGAANQILLTKDNAVRGNISTNVVVRDFRDTSQPACVMRNINTAGSVFGSIFYDRVSQAGVSLDLIDLGDEIILPPAGFLNVVENVANDSLTVTYQWRERPLEPSED